MAALTGDTAFQAPRRNFLRESIKKNHTQSWSYRLDTVLPTFPARYGGQLYVKSHKLTAAFHSADIPYTFGLPRIAHLNMTGERAEYAASFNFTEADATVSKTLMGYWWVKQLARLSAGLISLTMEIQTDLYFRRGRRTGMKPIS